MATNKPELNPQQPTKIAGVVTPPSTAPASVPVEKVPEKPKYPARMANGDILHEVIEQGRHRVEIIERKDPSQYIKFHGLCSCGVHGRFHEKADLLRYITAHLQRREHER